MLHYFTLSHYVTTGRSSSPRLHFYAIADAVTARELQF